MLAPLLFAVYFVHLCLPHYVLLYIMYIHRIQIGVGTPARGNAFLNSALRGRNPNIFIIGADEACNKNEFLFSNIILYSNDRLLWMCLPHYYLLYILYIIIMLCLPHYVLLYILYIHRIHSIVHRMDVVFKPIAYSNDRLLWMCLPHYYLLYILYITIMLCLPHYVLLYILYIHRIHSIVHRMDY